jgi:prolyl 4-hydroxylase
MIAHELNDINNFIMAWRFENTSFCDEILEYAKTKTPTRGSTLRGINLKNKDSFDITVGQDFDCQKYSENLQKCVDAYIEKYTYCNMGSPWGILEGVNIQKYLPKGGFHLWHCEREGFSNINNARHLVFMTYLNDVTDAGETEFFYQKLKFTPEKGMTVIWPAEWMFTHRGIASPTQEKNIITGWFSYHVSDVNGD